MVAVSIKELSTGVHHKSLSGLVRLDPVRTLAVTWEDLIEAVLVEKYHHPPVPLSFPPSYSTAKRGSSKQLQILRQKGNKRSWSYANLAQQKC
ncbi:hypothetical protein Bpfe_002635 [Biomphalaria pfeifferi]|uniref:Uncharacterized protein n=1 Tax=Biomphalaria pfeifferi TaxID=112525 RepID=A0AAD8C8V5_BIOPF|nr:hypothetical protein Bpfe_002635 [Biomphalaria pfeifferi]